jgi:hypothetical protein
LAAVVRKKEVIMAVNSKTVVNDDVLDMIKSRLEDLSFGYVTITVQDNKVVQLETTEKMRFRNSVNRF